MENLTVTQYTKRLDSVVNRLKYDLKGNDMENDRERSQYFLSIDH